MFDRKLRKEEKETRKEVVYKLHGLLNLPNAATDTGAEMRETGHVLA